MNRTIRDQIEAEKKRIERRLDEQYKNGKGNIIKAVFNGFVSNLKAWGNVRKCSSVIYIIQKK